MDQYSCHISDTQIKVAYVAYVFMSANAYRLTYLSYADHSDAVGFWVCWKEKPLPGLLWARSLISSGWRGFMPCISVSDSAQSVRLSSYDFSPLAHLHRSYQQNQWGIPLPEVLCGEAHSAHYLCLVGLCTGNPFIKITNSTGELLCFQP